ncbi:unnamed protein product [Rangifer tarandus platyrhynchus]|uniref:Uncharacterized protein n=2 Tax=Rangifer tarandus platyrhynchus TaxID=3082113 RepID=A0ACB0DRB6_RANTA|nr:unnamed protein product [Rangifer tarandus platyrhynchus]CAI9690839.1 unnamed protein product [Rangifer tarandus platyrhynchus]
MPGGAEAERQRKDVPASPVPPLGPPAFLRVGWHPASPGDLTRLVLRAALGFQEARAAAPAAPRASSAGGQGSRAGSGGRPRAAGRGHCPSGGPRRPGGSSVTEVELCLVTSGTTQFLMFSDSCLQRKEENT